MSKFYGTTKTEQEATALAMSREIVTEIVRFGVQQEQLLHIIKLLALELENRDYMVAICECVNEIRGEGVIEEVSSLIKN